MKIIMNKPNHICKNPNCNAEYYACDACDKSMGLNWHTLACSVDCFKEYMNFLDQEQDSKDGFKS